MWSDRYSSTDFDRLDGTPRWGRSNNCGGCGTRRVTVDDIRRWTGAKYTDEVYGPEFFEYDGVS